jgi:hypothetical protein
MNTNLSNRISTIEEEDITIVHYEPEQKTEGQFLRSMRPVVKWFGLLSTLIWGVGALSPETLRVPAYLQGWVFLIFIAWLFAYCAGVFNL